MDFNATAAPPSPDDDEVSEKAVHVHDHLLFNCGEMVPRSL